MRLQRLRGGSPRRATTVPELAVTAIIFFMFLLGIIEYARFMYTQNVLNNAAREGARFAVVHTTSATTTQVQDYVDGYLAGQGVALIGYNKYTNISVFQASTTTGADNGGGWANAGPGQAIGVTISGNYTLIVPKLLFWPTNLTIQGTAIMYSETT